MPIILNIPYIEGQPGFERLELLNLTSDRMRFAVVGHPKFIRESAALMPARMAGVLDGRGIRVTGAAPVSGKSTGRIEFAACYAAGH